MTHESSAAVSDSWDADGPALPDPAVLLAGLNPAQAQAVRHTDGPLLVVAGAGTGKTRVLTRRIGYLVATGTARPDGVLAVTFTNKAAREMRERVRALIGGASAELTMGSFHAVSMIILRRYAEAAGLSGPDFQVLDDDEQRQLVDAIVREDPENDPDMPARERREKVKALHQRVMAFKEEGWDLEEANRNFIPQNENETQAIAVYRAYQDALARRNAVDFPDLILKTVQLFDARPDVKRAWVNAFSHILVDEFQDTNTLQYRWLEHLAREHSNICIVGDPDQALYEWRGARPEILNGFADDWPGCRTIVLDTNYRSTDPILRIANAVVQDNPRPAPKELRSGIEGAEVTVEQHDTQAQETTRVAEAIRQRLDAGTSPDEIAVLFRSARPMMGFEQAFNQAGIDHEVVGGLRFYQREEVRDIHAYLRLALNPNDDLAFTRVVNKPLRRVGEKTAERVIAMLDTAQDLPAACRILAETGGRLQQSARQGLVQFAEEIEGLAEAAGRLGPGELIRETVSRTGYIVWRRETLGDQSWRERQDILDELARNADAYPTTPDYLQQIAIASAADHAQGRGQVRLSTVHAAKGLEFEVVFTPALEEGILPNAGALKADYGPAEERRIAHVAWTRAKRELIVSYALNRWGQPAEPSRFLSDTGLIDPEVRNDSAPMHKQRKQQMERKPARTAVKGFHRLPRRPR